jgi:hypothetical protein
MAGQQAYQGYMQGLTDKIPELAQMAYNRYNQEGQDMLNNIALLQGVGANARDLSDIRERLATLPGQGDVDAYIDNLELAHVITPDEAEMLTAEFTTPAQVGFDKRTWKVTNKGGRNWGGGVNGNAKAEDQYGNKYSMNDIVRNLVLSGWDEDKAKQWVIDEIQNKQGIGHW